MLNILGISRFLDLSFDVFGITIPMVVAIGVLPYPSPLSVPTSSASFTARKKRTTWCGWVCCSTLGSSFCCGLAVCCPALTSIPSGQPLVDAAGREPTFFEIRELAFGAVAASMVAYLAAQLCDVRLFHFWKRLTNGKHLWLRNNASTMVSQIVDTTAVILVTHFYAAALPVNADEPIWPQLMVFIASGYVFKLVVAALDTGPIYLAVAYLRPWLGLQENEEATG